jgi:hypothetical protein
LALLSSEKLINQLDETVIGLAALVEVSVMETGVTPVASATSVDSISGLTGTMEYWLVVSWPTFLGTLVTRYEIQRELRSIRQVLKNVEIVSFCASKAGRVSGDAGRRANPVLIDWTPLRALLSAPRQEQRLV